MTTDKILSQHRNGNCLITLLEDGSKTREWVDGETPYVDFPETMDVKITDYCTRGCAWCFESSTKRGKHADKDFILNILKPLPAGTELAIGGGNPLDFPDLEEILQVFRSRGVICNMTVNAGHIAQFADQIQKFRANKLVWGLGVSYDPKFHADVLNIIDDNTIVHLIAGYHNITDVRKLPKNLKLLILGYKTYGFGVGYAKKHEINLAEWRFWLPTILQKHHTSFDNRALNQLAVRKMIGEELWKEKFMGDDATFSFYIDMVKQEYAGSSTDSRKSCGSMSLSDIFADVKRKGDRVVSLI